MNYFNDIIADSEHFIDMPDCVDFPNHGSGTFGSNKLGKIIISKEFSSSDSGFSIVVKNRLI